MDPGSSPGRAFAYLLVLALALAYFTASPARVAFRYLLLAAAFIVLAICSWRLWSTTDLPGLFASNRLAYPAGHPDNAAAIFLVPFWPIMWLASGPKSRLPSGERRWDWPPGYWGSPC